MIDLHCFIYRTSAFPLVHKCNITIGDDFIIVSANRVKDSEIEIHTEIRATENLNEQYAICQVTTESGILVQKAEDLHVYSMSTF